MYFSVQNVHAMFEQRLVVPIKEVGVRSMMGKIPCRKCEHDIIAVARTSSRPACTKGLAFSNLRAATITTVRYSTSIIDRRLHHFIVEVRAATMSNKTLW